MNPSLEYLASPRFQGFKPGFERIKTLLAGLGNPERKLKYVHAAGTNGKGSFCAMLASILHQAGYRCGMYTSPYVISFHEQVQVDGAYLTDAELAEAVAALRPIADGMEDPPSQFELETALALWHFARRGCDIAVLETGMGGAWDATNVIPAPEVAALCTISLDHCGVLGSSVGEIAAIKAGILKPGCDCVLYPGEEAVEQVLAERCREVGARLFHPDFSRLKVREMSLTETRFDYAPCRELRLPLIGSYQPRNAAMAITAAQVLRTRGWHIPERAIRDGLKLVRWPGRFEILRREPLFILDGSHNPQGMAATVQSLKDHFGDQKFVLLVGVMADKDVPALADLLAQAASAFVTVAPPNPRAMEAGELARLLQERSGLAATACATVEEAVEKTLALAGREGYAAALGSLYFSSQVRRAVSGAQ